jgi:hypothetical protein
LARSSKTSWLEGPGDLKEADVEDVPVKGESVRVRGLPAAYSNQATSEALEMKTLGDGSQIATVNTATLEVLQFHHGVIEPKFDLAESKTVAERFGPAFKKVVAKIDELSGVDKQALEDAQTRFPAGSSGQNGDEASVEDGPSAERGGPAVPARAGA